MAAFPLGYEKRLSYRVLPIFAGQYTVFDKMNGVLRLAGTSVGSPDFLLGQL